MLDDEPRALTHIVLLTACAVAAFVALSLSVIYWSWLLIGVSFIMFCYYLSEIIREAGYLLRVRKENRDG